MLKNIDNQRQIVYWLRQYTWEDRKHAPALSAPVIEKSSNVEKLMDRCDLLNESNLDTNHYFNIEVHWESSRV